MSTLNQYRKRALTSNINFGAVALPVIMARYKEFKANALPQMICPEVDALKFYFLNHSMSEVAKRVDPDQPLGKYEAIADMYYEQLQVPVLRMFFYLLIICSRESRHVWDCSAVNSDTPTRKFVRGIRNSDHTEAYKRLKGIKNKIPVGEFTSELCELFFHGQWGSSYGGKKWGVVCACLDRFVRGVIPGEVMLDTAFTLAHNGGPIFNKGYLYKHYVELLDILNVQASGQIPQYIYSNGSSAAKAIKETHSIVADILQCEHFYYDVDYDIVKSIDYSDLPDEDLGGEYGGSKKGAYEVAPGQYIPKIEIERAA